MSNPKLHLNDGMADALSSRLARVQAMESAQQEEVFGSRIFQVKSGWETAQIAQDEAVTSVSTKAALKQIMDNPRVETIFIPASAELDIEDIRHVLKYSSQDKTLFVELAAQ